MYKNNKILQLKTKNDIFELIKTKRGKYGNKRTIN